MATEPVRLEPVTQLGASAGIVGSAVPARKRFVIRAAVAYNTSAVQAETVTIHIVPASGSPSAANIVSRRSVPSEGTTSLVNLVSHVLHAGETIQALASTGSTVNLLISGQFIDNDAITA